MRIDTDIIKEAADSRIVICRKLEENLKEFDKIIKEFRTYDELEEICLQGQNIYEGIIRDIRMIRQTGTALHSIARICEDTEKRIAAIPDNAGFIRTREEGIINNLNPLRPVYERVIKGESLNIGKGEDN